MTVLIVWLLLSALTAALTCLLLRGGQLADRPVARPVPTPVGTGRRPSPSARRRAEGMAEFTG